LVWYQHGVRILAMFAAMALCVMGCGGPSGPSSSVTGVPSASTVAINPARIDRVRGDLPQGYEVTEVATRIAPFAQWGFGAGWTADPPQCGVLADPLATLAEPATSKGWSASGPGGIVYAVVAASPPEPVRLDPAVVTDCAQWAVSGGRTTGSVAATTGPTIDGAATVAMSTAITTVVEGGTETHSHADTVTAYVDDYVVFVTVVTDPGSPNPQLGQDFAATLLTKSVAALRG
jgi:hypothetical protein